MSSTNNRKIIIHLATILGMPFVQENDMFQMCPVNGHIFFYVPISGVNIKNMSTRFMIYVASTIKYY